MTEPDIIYARSLYAAEDGDMNKLEQKLVVELTALPNVRWWHRNIARQGFSINGFIKHYCFEKLSPLLSKMQAGNANQCK